MKKWYPLMVFMTVFCHSISGISIGELNTNWDRDHILQYFSDRKWGHTTRNYTDDGWNNHTLKIENITLSVVNNCNLNILFFGKKTAAMEFSGLFIHLLGNKDSDQQAALKKQKADIARLVLFLRSRFGREKKCSGTSMAEHDTYYVWRTKQCAFERIILQITQSPSMDLPLVTLRVETAAYERMIFSGISETGKSRFLTGFGPSGHMLLSASSWIPPMYGYHFSPAAAADGNPDTSWQVSSKNWKNSWLDIRKVLWVKQGITARYSLSLINGFASRHRQFGDLYTGNSRLKKIRVLWGDNLEFSKTIVLRDNTRNLQQVTIIPYRYNGRPLRIRIRILSVYPGKKWRDIAVSEVRLDRIK